MAYEVRGIDHVQVAAPPGCEERARWFYGEVLGMTEVAKPPALQARGGVWFQCGEHQLHVGVETSFAPALKAHPALRVAGLPGLQERLSRLGVPFTPDELLPGAARIYVNDPFGNRLELLEWPGRTDG